MFGYLLKGFLELFFSCSLLHFLHGFYYYRRRQNWSYFRLSGDFCLLAGILRLLGFRQLVSVESCLNFISDYGVHVYGSSSLNRYRLADRRGLYWLMNYGSRYWNWCWNWSNHDRSRLRNGSRYGLARDSKTVNRCLLLMSQIVIRQSCLDCCVNGGFDSGSIGCGV